MSNFVIFGFLPEWFRNWLTPIWLIGIGVAAGLLILVLLWGILKVLSQVAPLRAIAENTTSRRVATTVIGLVLSGLFIAFAQRGAGASLTADTEDTFFLSALYLSVVGFSLAYLLVAFLSPRNVDEIPLALTEGVLWPIFVMSLMVVGIGIAGFTFVRQPENVFRSILRIPHVGLHVIEETIKAAPEGEDPKQVQIPFGVRREELLTFTIRSSESIELAPQKDSGVGNYSRVEARGGEDYRWIRNDQTEQLFPDPVIDNLYVINQGARDASLRLVVRTAPPVPEVWTIVYSAASVIGVFLLYLLLRTSMPKAFAVALSTAKSEIAQPLFVTLAALGVVSLLIFVIIPYHTLGEDIKVLKDTGLVLIMVFGIVQAVWAASMSISEEIEGRTALTVLSKPLGRRSFIIGKFLGIFWTVLVLFIILSLVFLVVVAYKPIYEAKENSNEDPTWQQCHFEMVRVMPGLTLAFMETILLAAISVAISTRLPMIANFVICLTIYVLGHLTPLIVQSSVKAEAFNIVVFVAQFIATIFPVLEHFNIQAAVAGGVDVPYLYLGWAFLYCSIYGMIALLLALFLFEDRDLA